MSGGNKTHVTAHGTMQSYLIGFLLSLALTLIPFGLVMYPGFSREIILQAITAIAILQILVQLLYFLHLNPRTDEGWNLLAFVFTAVIIIILVGGSLWIMHHLNHNMRVM